MELRARVTEDANCTYVVGDTVLMPYADCLRVVSVFGYHGIVEHEKFPFLKELAEMLMNDETVARAEFFANGDLVISVVETRDGEHAITTFRREWTA